MNEQEAKAKSYPTTGDLNAIRAAVDEIYREEGRDARLAELVAGHDLDDLINALEGEYPEGAEVARPMVRLLDALYTANECGIEFASAWRMADAY